MPRDAAIPNGYKLAFSNKRVLYVAYPSFGELISKVGKWRHTGFLPASGVIHRGNADAEDYITLCAYTPEGHAVLRKIRELVAAEGWSTHWVPCTFCGERETHTSRCTYAFATWQGPV